jgi:hypothetical protein
MDVHDEVVGQISLDADVDGLLRRIKEIMTIPLLIKDVYGIERELIIPIEIKIGPNWGSLKEVEVR